MKEIGGYIELDRYSGEMLHNKAIALNSGRNCLAYLIKAKKIKKILLPYFLCNSVSNVCLRENVEVKYYSIGMNFLPQDIYVDDNEWLYVVNYYGQLSNHKIKELLKKYKRVILDNAQAYFKNSVDGVDTLYTCRKYFGVADGAFLYTDSVLSEQLPRDESFERMHFLLGRFEINASQFYHEYVRNNKFFEDEPIKVMSKLTYNLLHGIDYGFVKNRRTENFIYLHKAFEKINKVNLIIPEGAFMYPLYVENGEEVRKKLQQKKIYIPTLWPDVFNICNEKELEYCMAKSILPLPLDQRYDLEDMDCIVQEVFRCIN